MNSKNCLRALACAGAVLGGFSASADIPASAYVQDGLVVQFDGIENAGVGRHDAASTVWVDLIGGHDMTLVEGVSGGERLLASAGGSLSQPQEPAAVSFEGRGHILW